MSHFEALLLFAALVSPALACLLREETGARIRFALWSFAGFTGFAVAVGWLMFALGA